jgi:hypothetical protein
MAAPQADALAASKTKVDQSEHRGTSATLSARIVSGASRCMSGSGEHLKDEVRIYYFNLYSC